MNPLLIIAAPFLFCLFMAIYSAVMSIREGKRVWGRKATDVKK